MSPEQAERATSTGSGPASDVYSLGATLYCLLTGRPPFDGPTSATVLRERPAGRVPAAAAGRPERSTRALEAVCLKAMAMQPEDRYATAAALAEDIERWMADEPVIGLARAAGSPGPAMDAAAIAPLVSSAAAVLAFGLAGLAGFAMVLAGMNREPRRQGMPSWRTGTGNSIVNASEPMRREALAIDAVTKFRDAVQSNAELKNRPELDGLRKVLLKEPLEFFRQLKDELQADRDTRPDALAKVAGAGRDLAITTAEIGSVTDAIRSFSESIDILERLVRERPGDLAYRRDLASGLHGLASLLGETARPDESLRLYRRSLAIRERLRASTPMTPITTTVWPTARAVSDSCCTRWVDPPRRWSRTVSRCRSASD